MSKPDIRNRIIAIRKVRGADLRPNPENPRRHPREQRDAMAGILHEVGQAGVLLAYRDPEAPDRLTLIDGHERSEDFGDLEWDVAETDLTPTEARKLMALYDPLAAMAETEAQALADLLAQVEAEDPALQSMMRALEEKADSLSLPAQPTAEELGATEREPCPRDQCWFYVEYYGEPERFEKLRSLLADSMKGAHDIDKDAFEALVCDGG